MRATTSLKRRLREPKILVAPGAYDCLTAKIIERSHFEAVYMTGAGTSVAKLGVPDLGIATLADMAANAAAIAAAFEIPLIADADTGYGGRRSEGKLGMSPFLSPPLFRATSPPEVS